MARVTSRSTIDRPIDVVFAVITDVEQTGRWFPGDVDEHWTTPPPHGVGSTRHAVVRTFGRRSENDAVATEYDPPFRAAMRGTTPNAPFHVTIECGEVAGGTLVVVTSEIAFTGPARLIGPLVTAGYGWAWGRGLRTLKRKLEAGELEPRSA